MPAGEVPLHVRERFFQRAAVLSRHFLSWAFPRHLRKGPSGFIVPRAGAARWVPAGEVKLQLR